MGQRRRAVVERPAEPYSATIWMECLRQLGWRAGVASEVLEWGPKASPIRGVLPCDAIRICRTMKRNRLIWRKLRAIRFSRELFLKRLSSGRYSPLLAAGDYQLRRRREALIEKDRACGLSLLTASAEGWSPEKSRSRSVTQ